MDRRYISVAMIILLCSSAVCSTSLYYNRDPACGSQYYAIEKKKQAMGVLTSQEAAIATKCADDGYKSGALMCCCSALCLSAIGVVMTRMQPGRL
jgi:hypothetical protein